MGGKHLKKLRAEKSKVKLKQKKTLPKGQNVTDTSFKVKKIVTVEQLKKVDENEPVSSWNIPLKDLLVRLNHYNYMSRLNGLTGIRELIKSYPDTLKGPSLRTMVARILELLTDPEYKVRKTAVDLLGYIFSLLPENSLIPFHDILIVHLSCAMTHRDIAIQKDSIKYIDVIIKYAPEAVLRNYQNLMQQFIRILKVYFYGSRSEVQVSKSLKLDLENTRTEMFSRFYQILAIAYSVSNDLEKSEYEIFNINKGKKRLYLRGLKNDYKKIPDLSSLFKNPTNKESNLVTSESSELQSQISIIMPLLFDSWTEFTPGRQNDGFISEFVLSESTGALLYVILRIVLLVYEKVVATGDSALTDWFVSAYGASFKKSFMTNFPYTPSMSSKRSDNSLNGEVVYQNSNTFVMQNLIVCYLSYCFKLKYKNGEQESKIEKYILNTLMSKNPQGVELLSKVVEVMLNSPRNKKSDTIVTTLVKAYNASNVPEFRRRLFGFLVNIILENNMAYQTNHSLNNWLQNLPQRLVKPRISLYVIEAALKIITRPIGAEVLKKIETMAVEIVENLRTVKIEGIDQFEGQKLIANILYWCSNNVLEDVIRKLIGHKGYPQELRSYIIEVFSHRLTGQSSY